MNILSKISLSIKAALPPIDAKISILLMSVFLPMSKGINTELLIETIMASLEAADNQDRLSMQAPSLPILYF